MSGFPDLLFFGSLCHPSFRFLLLFIIRLLPFRTTLSDSVEIFGIESAQLSLTYAGKIEPLKFIELKNNVD